MGNRPTSGRPASQVQLEKKQLRKLKFRRNGIWRMTRKPYPITTNGRKWWFLKRFLH